MPISWDILGQTVNPIRDVFVRDWWDLYRITGAGNDQACLRAWCEMFLGYDDAFVAQVDEKWGVVAAAIIQAAGWSSDVLRGVSRCWWVSSGATGFDPSREESRCECRECKHLLGPDEVDPLCLYRVHVTDDERFEISQRSRDIAFNVRPALVAEYWDRPLALYELACERETATRLGQRASAQASGPTPSERKRKKSHERIYDKCGLGPSVLD